MVFVLIFLLIETQIV